MGGGLIQAMLERKYSFLKEVFLYLDIIISDKDGDHELRKTITMIMIKMVISFATQLPPPFLPPPLLPSDESENPDGCGSNIAYAYFTTFFVSPQPPIHKLV